MRILALLGLALSLGMAQSIRVSVPMCSTGIGLSGDPLPDGMADACWRLLEADAYPVVVNSIGFPIPPWLANSSASKWIGPRADAAIGSLPGIYTYRSRFTLPAGFASAELTGRWASDNSGALKLNGGVVSEAGTYSDPAGVSGRSFVEWTTFAVKQGFVPGSNILEFVVDNWTSPRYTGPADWLNPTGVRVELGLTATLTCPVCPPPLNDRITWVDRTEVKCAPAQCAATEVESTWVPRSAVQVYRNNVLMLPEVDYLTEGWAGKFRVRFRTPLVDGEVVEILYALPRGVGWVIWGVDPKMFPGRIP